MYEVLILFLCFQLEICTSFWTLPTQMRWPWVKRPWRRSSWQVGVKGHCMLGKQSDFFSLIQFIPQKVGMFSELNEQIQGYTSEWDTGNRFLSFFFYTWWWAFTMPIVKAYSAPSCGIITVLVLVLWLIIRNII